MMFDVPRDQIIPVSDITVRLDDRPHPYEQANIADIEANWRRELANSPKLFDGEMILLSHVAYRDGRIEGSCHPIRFPTFLHWRRNRSASAGFHVFASAVPVSSDGALIAIRMGPHTANAGRVYFAAGSFERQDFSGGVADVAHNIHREVAEETGIDLAPCDRDETYHAYCSSAGLTLIRRYYLTEDAETVADRIRAFIAADPEPEADEAVIIRDESDVPDSAPVHMQPLVRWHFCGNGSAPPET